MAMERKRCKLNYVLDVATPLFSAKTELMRFLSTCGRRLHSSLKPKLGGEELMVEIRAPMSVVDDLVVPFLLISGWKKQTCGKGAILLATSNGDTVRSTIGGMHLIPGLSDPMRRVKFVDSEEIFDEMKKIRNMSGCNYAINPKDSKIRKAVLHEYAVSELGNDFLGKKPSMTLIAHAIMEKRIKDKTWLGFDSMVKIVVTEEKPFSVLVVSGRNGYKVFRMKYYTDKYVFLVENGKIRCRKV